MHQIHIQHPYTKLCSALQKIRFFAIRFALAVALFNVLQTK